MFRFVRESLGEKTGYRYIDSATRIGIHHLETNTHLRVLSSNGKTGMGIVGLPGAGSRRARELGSERRRPYVGRHQHGSR